MGEIGAKLIEFIRMLWPFRIVEESERGGKFVRGHWRSILGPGCYWNWPFFCDIKAMSIAKGIVFSRRIDIQLSDGKHLSCAASATVRIVDVQKALLDMDSYEETTEELLTSVFADKLMDVDAERVTNPEKRGRLLADLARWVQKEADDYGMEFTKVRFTSLVLDAPSLRLLGDTPTRVDPAKARDQSAA